MNLDLLIKLVKLANNNPNEHEANSAARRACKLIAEGNYQFSEVKKAADKVPPPTKSQTAHSWTHERTGRDPFEDYFKDVGWAGFRESAQQARNEKERQRAAEFDKEQRRRNQQNVYEPSSRQQDFYNQQNAYRPGMGFEGQENVKKPKIRRVCTKCGLDVETSNMKDPFVCGVCIWNEYNEKRVNAEKAAYQKIKDYDF